MSVLGRLIESMERSVKESPTPAPVRPGEFAAALREIDHRLRALEPREPMLISRAEAQTVIDKIEAEAAAVGGPIAVGMRRALAIIRDEDAGTGPDPGVQAPDSNPMHAFGMGRGD